MSRQGFTLPGVIDDQGTVTVMVEPIDAAALLRKLSGPEYREINQELKDESGDIARNLKNKLVQYAHAPGVPPQAALVAKSIRVKRDRYVAVTIGGPKKVGRPYRQRQRTTRVKGKNGKVGFVYGNSGRRRKISAPAGALLWGSEFGAAVGIHRFTKPRNPDGYWINPAVDDYAPTASKLWRAALNRALRKAGW